MSVAPAEVRLVRPPRPVIATALGLILALTLVMTVKAIATINDRPGGWATTWSQVVDSRHLPSFLGGHHQHPAPAASTPSAAPAR